MRRADEIGWRGAGVVCYNCCTPQHPRIEIDPAVMGGKPVIRGMRVTVEQVLRECARGASAAEIAHQYPRLTSEDVAAALAFAADCLAHETIVAAE